MKNSTFHTLLICLTICLSLSSAASDYDKEKRWADQIIDSLFDGEPVFLDTDDHQFLAIHTEPETESSSGVVVLHGTGVHPDWQTVINPLRVGLAEHGFHTLSLQMPVLANEAKQQDYIKLFPEVTPRVDAALKFLQDREINQIFIIGHSLGASMAAYYLSNSKLRLSGFIAIGLTTGFKGTAMDNLNHLSAVTVPILDLYGTDDLDNVVEFAQQRHEAANPEINYKQVEVENADHFFNGEEQQLLDHVLTWLNPLVD